MGFDNIGICIKQNRAYAGLTQDDLAEQLGTDRTIISKIENGHIEDAYTIAKIGLILGNKLITRYAIGLQVEPIKNMCEV